jgi:hypothetical protein
MCMKRFRKRFVFLLKARQGAIHPQPGKGLDDYFASIFPRHHGKLDAIVASARVALEGPADGQLRG